MGFEWGPKGSITDFVDHVKEATEAAGRQMAEDAGKRMVARVKENTPVEQFMKTIATFSNGRYTRVDAPGHLRDSIDLKEIKVYTDVEGRHVWESGAETNVAYAPYVEEGTGLWGPNHAKYLIKPKKPGGWLSWITQHGFTRRDGTLVAPGTRVFAKEVMHPGSPGQHMFAIGAAMIEHEFEEIAQDALAEWRRRSEAWA